MAIEIEGNNCSGPEPCTTPRYDNINRPAHYTEGRRYEPIDVIEDWKLGFNLGNAVKYISRAGRKTDELEDLKKARWYLDRHIQNIENIENSTK